MYVILNELPSDEFDLHMERPDQIIAKRTVVGPTTSGDWDVIEMDTQQETDPVYVASPAANVTNTLINNRNTAYSRGDRRGQ